jgi:cystathionine gamma-synthase
VNSFFIHLSIQAFAEALVARFGKAGEKAFLFPSSSVAARCRDFVMRYTPCSLRCNYQHATFKIKDIEVVDLILREPDVDDGGLQQSTTVLSMVIVPDSIYPVAKQFWQHSGDGVSSRRAEFFHKAFDDGHLEPRISNELLDSSSRLVNKGPRRYQRTEADDSAMIHSSFETSIKGQGQGDKIDHLQFVEERFGRNLDMSLAANAKVAIRRRIAGTLTADVNLEDALSISEEAYSARQTQGLSVDDVYLWPTGMSAIFNTHRTLLETRGPMKSIMFGYDSTSLLRTCPR